MLTLGVFSVKVRTHVLDKRSYQRSYIPSPAQRHLVSKSKNQSGVKIPPTPGQDCSLPPFLSALEPMFAPVVEGSRGQNHGEFIGRLSTVGPATPGLIPEVAPRQETHHPLRKALPHHKGEVHLHRDEVAMRRGFLTKILTAYGAETSLADEGWGRA